MIFNRLFSLLTIPIYFVIFYVWRYTYMETSNYNFYKYRFRRYLVTKRPKFSQIREGTRQRWFLFSKILHFLLHFFIKRVSGELFDYYVFVLKEEKPKRSCSQLLVSIQIEREVLLRYVISLCTNLVLRFHQVFYPSNKV